MTAAHAAECVMQLADYVVPLHEKGYVFTLGPDPATAAYLPCIEGI